MSVCRGNLPEQWSMINDRGATKSHSSWIKINCLRPNIVQNSKQFLTSFETDSHEVKLNVLLEHTTSHLPRIDVEVTNKVRFNVIYVYFGQVFMKYLQKNRLVGLVVDCLYYYLFKVWKKYSKKYVSMLSVSLENLI